MSEGENRERPPVHESIDVIDFETIYRTEKWWFTVILAKAWGKTRIYMYLHNMKDGQWKRKQKITVPDRQWAEVKSAVERFQGMM